MESIYGSAIQGLVRSIKANHLNYKYIEDGDLSKIISIGLKHLRTTCLKKIYSFNNFLRDYGHALSGYKLNKVLISLNKELEVCEDSLKSSSLLNSISKISDNLEKLKDLNLFITLKGAEASFCYKKLDEPIKRRFHLLRYSKKGLVEDKIPEKFKKSSYEPKSSFKIPNFQTLTSKTGISVPACFIHKFDSEVLRQVVLMG